MCGEVTITIDYQDQLMRRGSRGPRHHVDLMLAYTQADNR